MTQRFMITTAIDYPNGSPHMGHAYEKIVADTYARWHRLLGYETFFLTGTDENGQKLVKAAEVEGRPTPDYVDEQVQKFRHLCDKLSLSHDDFIRTTELRHRETCYDFWSRLKAKGDIYFGDYEGLYCVACESFYTETQIEGGICPVHGTALEKVKEKGYFFRLSAYADWVKGIIMSDKSRVCPASVRKEMLNRIEKEPIRDLSISRPNQGWGIPVPDDSNYVIYTWFDALINYVSAVADDKRASFWPASMHVIGKDIVWFHTVIWFSILKAVDKPLPEQVYVHGMVLGEDGRKMSKTLQNGVDPEWVLSHFPLDSFRYYLLRAIPSGLDGAFVRKDLVARHNSELANDLGNLVSRVVKLAMKKWVPSISAEGLNQNLETAHVAPRMEQAMKAREHHRALEFLWELVGKTNEYLNQMEPWKKAGDSSEFRTCMVNALYSISVISVYLDPFMPSIAKKMKEILGRPDLQPKNLAFQQMRLDLQDPPPLFPKIEL